MEDAEDIDVEVETGSKSLKNLREGATRKSAEKIDGMVALAMAVAARIK